MDSKQTEISTLGEFGLIERLTKDFPLQNPSSKKGVGDDAAVLDFGDNEVLVTTDLLLEGIHFDLRYVPLKHLGYKAAIVNFSDIYAMAGTPKQITACRAVSRLSISRHCTPASGLLVKTTAWILLAAILPLPLRGLLFLLRVSANAVKVKP